jgi:hypothetical protein
VGGGIVADSDPEREYQETLSKGRALEEALRTVAARPRASRATRARKDIDEQRLDGRPER